MVSLKRYFQAYVKIMPQRVKIIRSLMRQKLLLDKKLKENRNFRGRENIVVILNKLKSIIGENALFVAERRNKQTLRHYVWKFSKSFKFLIYRKNFIVHKLPTESEYATQILKILNDSIRDSEFLYKTSENLDKIYREEVGALNKNDVDLYLKLVQNENVLINSITNYGANIQQRQGGIFNFIKFYYKELKASGALKSQKDYLVILFLISITSFPLLYALSFMEEKGVYNFVWWLSSITSFLLISLAVGDIQSITPLGKTIRKFIMDTI